MDAFSRRTLLRGLSAAAVAGAAGSALGCSAKTTTGTSGRIGADVLPTFAKAGNAEPALKSASPLGMIRCAFGEMTIGSAWAARGSGERPRGNAL